MIKQKRKVGWKTGRQPGGECKVNGDKSLSNNKKDLKKKKEMQKRCIQHKENVEDKGSTKAPAGSHAKRIMKEK